MRRQCQTGLAMGWIVLVLALVGAVSIVALYVGPLRQVVTLRQQLADREQRLADVEAKLQALTLQLTNLQAERKTVDEKLGALRNQLAAGLADVERFRAEATAAKKQYEQMTAERDQLHTQLTEASGERDRLKERLQIVDNEKTLLEQSASHARERLALLDRDYRQAVNTLAQLQSQPSVQGGLGSLGTAASLSLEPSTALAAAAVTPPATEAAASRIPGAVELPPIMVHKDVTVAVQPITGHVIQVDPMRHFLILDRGSSHGVKVGTVFSVLRGATPIGRATVMRLRPDLSACDALPTDRAEEFRPGDLAVQLGA